MKVTSARRAAVSLFVAGFIITGCSLLPDKAVAPKAGDVLYIYPDGSMKFRGHPIPKKDVVIYEDGDGGEKAAVRIRVKPLHPDFFRDSIVVERVPVEHKMKDTNSKGKQTE